MKRFFCAALGLLLAGLLCLGAAGAEGAVRAGDPGGMVSFVLPAGWTEESAQAGREVWQAVYGAGDAARLEVTVRDMLPAAEAALGRMDRAAEASYRQAYRGLEPLLGGEGLLAGQGTEATLGGRMCAWMRRQAAPSGPGWPASARA